jgi:hypothetical protein
VYVVAQVRSRVHRLHTQFIHARNWRFHLQTPFLIGQGRRSLPPPPPSIPMYNFPILLSQRVRLRYPRGLEGTNATLYSYHTHLTLFPVSCHPPSKYANILPHTFRKMLRCNLRSACTFFRRRLCGAGWLH